MSISSLRESVKFKLNAWPFIHLPPQIQSHGHERLTNENDITHLTKIFLERKSILLISGIIQQYSMMEYLFIRASPKTIAYLVSSLGFTKLVDKIDIFYDLLWYLNTFGDVSESGFNQEEISYISGLTINELISLFPLHTVSKGYNTKASLLFSIVSHVDPRSTIFPDKPNRSSLIDRYPPDVIWRLYQAYKYKLYSTFSPYRLVSELSIINTIDNIFLYTTSNNVDYLIDLYGVIFPEDPSNTEDKINKFLLQIRYYDNVLTRPPNIEYPKNFIIDQIAPVEDLHNAQQYLLQLTTREILQGYKYEDPWTDRIELIREISEQLIPTWSWHHSYCKNDDTFNVEESILHGKMNKYDPNNPTVSYGNIQYYRCYQLDELIYVFKESQNFIDPNYHRDLTGFDPASGRLYSSTFTMKSIQKLIHLLNGRLPLDYNRVKINELITIINTIIDEQETKLVRLRSEYDLFDDHQQHLAKLFIAWIFFYGIWMRFWKGPGNPWPYNPNIDIDICVPTTRDEHIDIQNNILTLINAQIHGDVTVNEWINKLPVINYDFNNNRFTISTDTIVEILPGYLTATHCMGIGGNLFVGIGYVLITELLKENINTFISAILSSLLNLELEVVDYLLSPKSELYPYIESINKRQDIDVNLRNKITVLRDRRKSLTTNLNPSLNNFDLTQLRANKHIY